MAEKFGLKIGLEGEKEFKRSLSEINAAFKVLGSEMKLNPGSARMTVLPLCLRWEKLQVIQRLRLAEG